MAPVAQTIDCPKCGAPLARSGGQAVCSFCGTVSVIGEPVAKDSPLKTVALGSPIWLQPWADAYKWLWPRSETRLMVLPFADPYEDPSRPDCVHVTLADQLALETRLHVSASVGVRESLTTAIQDFTGPILPYEDALHWVSDFEPPPVAVAWGEWGADDSRDVQLRARSPAHGDPAMVLETTAPITAAADTVLDWLVAQGRATRVAAPSWYGPPPMSIRLGYQSVIQGMIFFILGKHGYFRVTAKNYALYTEKAFAVASDSRAPPQCRLLPLSLAILASESGHLDAGHRKQALDCARGASEQDDLVTWLAPYLLHALGAVDEAEARVASLRAEGALTGEYGAWVEAIGKGP